MKTRFDEFVKLHNGPEPLVIANAWNVVSAKTFEGQKYRAIATSSSAVADTLGYKDGEEMSFDQYLFVIERIAASVSVPFSVDLEGGYGATPEKICENLLRLAEVGVSGINLEDSVMNNGKRSILPAEQFAEKLRQITRILKSNDCQIFINVRCDSFLLGLPDTLNDALSRIKSYQDTGVHGIFLPCIKDLADIAKATQASKLPVNVMCIPGLPNFKALQDAGVKRISMGPFPKIALYAGLEKMAEKIMADGSFDSLF